MRRRLGSAPSVRPSPPPAIDGENGRGGDDRGEGMTAERRPLHVAAAVSMPSQAADVQSMQSSVSEMSGLVGLGTEESLAVGSSNLGVRFDDAMIGTPVAGNRSRASTGTRSSGNGENIDLRAMSAGFVFSADIDTASGHKWSDILSSPSNDAIFSPSRELTKAGNLHGLGLRAASERAKTLSKCGKRCATLLADVSALHDSFALSILQACDKLASISAPSISPLLKETNRCLTSFAKQTQGLAICIKGSVARPLHGSSSAMAEAVPRIFNKYALTRAQCASARQSALRMRQRYKRAVMDAEAAIRDLKRVKQEKDAAAASSASGDVASGRSTPAGPRTTPNGPASAPTPTLRNGGSGGVDTITKSIGLIAPSTTSWEDVKRRFGMKHGLSKSSQIVMKALEEVQACEAQYCALVEEENQAVARAQTMEFMALESLQKLEEERLQFLVETLDRALLAEKGALDKMILLLQSETGREEDTSSVDSDANASAESQSQTSLSSSVFNMITPQGNNENYASAIQEAIALNMPEEVGRWRDTIKSRLREQSNCTYALKAVAVYFNDIAEAAIDFSTKLQSRLADEGYVLRGGSSSTSKSKGSSTLALALNECEGDRALACWNKYVDALSSSARAASDLGTKIHTDSEEMVGKLLVSAEKDLRSAIESEEMRWKHCTDHARSEATSRLRHEQSVAALEKAQERMAVGAASFASSSASVSQQYGLSSPMTKALGGMLSMLPSGMEDEAMAKMLNSEQRLALAKKTLDEATAKQQRDKLAYESAQVAKDKAIQSYTATAHAADNQAVAKADALWSAVSGGFEVILSFFQHYREVRYDGINPATEKVQECNGTVILEDMREWGKAMQQNLLSHLERSGVEIIPGPGGKRLIRRKHLAGRSEKESYGYSLKVKLVDSKNVYKLLEFVVAEGDSETLEGERTCPRDNDGDDDEDDQSTSTNSKSKRFPPSNGVAATSTSMAMSEHAPSNSTCGIATADAIPRSLSTPSVPIERMSVATKELKSLAETLKGAAAGPEESAPKPTDAATSAETQLFLAHFWDGDREGEDGDDGDEQMSKPPTIIESFSCAYWPKETEGFISPLLHGRMFVTSTAMYFIGWGDKKLILKWEDVISITKDTIGPLDNSIRVTYDVGEGESSYFFGSFAYSYREKAFQLLDQLSTVARQLTDLTGKKKKKKKKSVPAVPPDETLKKMEHVLTKKLKGVSLQHFYNMCWTENADAEGGPFYRSFLESQKGHDISVSDWEIADEGADSYTHPWSGEKMTQKRIVKFKFTRTTHLYVGPPTAGVTQTQFCRMEGDDKFVLTMTVEMDGIPYADCFAVEVRWVARRAGKDLVIDIGVFVNFLKSTMLKSKIQSGTILETKPVHFALFDAAKEVCGAGEEGDDEEDEEGEEGSSARPKPRSLYGALKVLLSLLRALFTSAPARAVGSRIKSCGTAFIQHKLVRLVLGGAFTLLVIGLTWKLIALLPSRAPHPPLSGDVVTNEQVQAMNERMDMLSGEMHEVRKILQAILAELRYGRNNADSGSDRDNEAAILPDFFGDEL